MAKSFHTILNEGTIEVKHLGEDATFDLPTWLTAASSILADEVALLEWAQEHEVLHGLLHSGIQQEIIRIRAAARPTIYSYADFDKYKAAIKLLSNVEDYHTNERDCQISMRLLKDDKAQDRIDNYVCKEVKKPGTTKKGEVTKTDAITALLKKGLSVEDILKVVEEQKTAKQQE